MVKAPGYVQLLRQNGGFRWLWLGVVVSFFGDWFALIALYAVADELVGTAGAIAAILIGKTLPIFAISPVAGVLLDRFDRRGLLIATDVARCVLTVAMMGAYALESFALVIACLVVKVAFSGIFIPGRTAVIPQLTTTAELPVAMALSGGTWSVMLALGAALGGLVTASVGITGALALDAVTFLISAGFLARLPALPPTSADAPARATLAQGARYLWGRGYLIAVLSGKSGIALTTGALVALPIIGNGVFPETAGPVYVGLLFAARGVGALLGSLGTRRVVGDQSAALARTVPPAYLLAALGLVGVGLAPTLGLAALAYVVTMVGHATVWVFTGILAQRAVPREFRGRLFALEFGMMTLTSAFLSWISGWSMDELGLGPRDVHFVAAALMVVPAGGFALALGLWGVREPPASPEPRQGSDA